MQRLDSVPRLFAYAGILVALCGTLGSCIQVTTRQPLKLLTQPPPSNDKQYCAWYGDDRGNLLYFGESAFWSAYRSKEGDPTAVLRSPGRQLIGRVDLTHWALLPPLDVTLPGSRSGVWDVLAHPNGRIYFTTYFDLSGYVDPATGHSQRFESAGVGLNELEVGPDRGVLVTRYAGPGDSDGSVVVLDPDGRIRDEWILAPPPGYRVAPKSVAYDRTRKEIWVTTDLLPTGTGPIRHDARVLDDDGREIARFDDPELHFIAFDTDGSGVAAEVDDGGLFLRVISRGARGAPGHRGRRFPVDEYFRRDADFVQDIKFAPGGRAVVTRWSGRVHIVEPGGNDIQSVRLPRLAADGLYYTAVLRDDGICATLCAEVNVVCLGAPVL